MKKGTTESGGKLKWAHGCDGLNHIDWLWEDFPNENGYHNSLVIVKRGPSDMSCENTDGDTELGEFDYEERLIQSKT